MGAIEAIVFALFLLFMVVSTVIRGLWALMRAGRRAIRRERPRVPEQAPRSGLSNNEPPPVRRRAELARTETAAVALETPTVRDTATEDGSELPLWPTTMLNTDRNELLRAWIWQEILAPPVSQRQRRGSQRAHGRN